MLAKIISFAPNRTDAASKLAKALQSAHIGGVKTNRDFLINCLNTEEFIKGDTTSDFIERVNPSRKLEIEEDEIDHQGLKDKVYKIIDDNSIARAQNHSKEKIQK